MNYHDTETNLLTVDPDISTDIFNIDLRLEHPRTSLRITSNMITLALILGEEYYILQPLHHIATVIQENTADHSHTKTQNWC